MQYNLHIDINCIWETMACTPRTECDKPFSQANEMLATICNMYSNIVPT